MDLLLVMTQQDSTIPFVAFAWGVDRKIIWKMKEKMLASQGGMMELLLLRKNKKTMEKHY